MDVSILWPDTHAPYHSRRCVNVILLVIEYLAERCKEIVFGGDLLDFYAVSRHRKHPDMNHILMKEITEGNELMDLIDQRAPIPKKRWLIGNHEDRLFTYIADRAPALFGVTGLEELMKLSERPLWKIHSYNSHQKLHVLGSDLRARHIPPASSAKASLAKAMRSLAYFHIHRIEQRTQTDIDGNRHIAFSCGWLGDPAFMDVFGYTPSRQNWQWGFAAVYGEQDEQKFTPVIIPIHDDYSCIFEGRRFQG